MSFIPCFKSREFLRKPFEDISILTNFYVCQESFLQDGAVGEFYLRLFADVDTNLSFLI